MIAGTELLGGLWPPFTDAVVWLLQAADANGKSIGIVSGYRSFDEQAALYAQGRTPAEVAAHVYKRGTGLSVTDAWPGASPHNFGLAVDLEGVDLAWIKSLASQVGFGTVSWDPPHIEWPNWRSLLV